MNFKNDTKQLQRYSIALRAFILLPPAAGFYITSWNFLFPIAVCIAFECFVWLMYFHFKKKNNIISTSWVAYSALSPEILTISAMFMFCYGGVLRVEIWIAIILFIIGCIYTNSFPSGKHFDTKRLARYLRKGEYDGAWPKWSELDWFGKLFLYVMWGPTFAALMMFGIAMWADNLPEAAQHKYVMAGGYAFTFFAMNMTAFRIWFQRVKRTVKEHNLDW